MSWKKKLRVVFACMTLEAAVLFGVPIRPEQIEELMHQMNQPKLAHVLKEEADGGDGNAGDGNGGAGNGGDGGNGSTHEATKRTEANGAS